MAKLSFNRLASVTHYNSKSMPTNNNDYSSYIKIIELD